VITVVMVEFRNEITGHDPRVRQVAKRCGVDESSRGCGMQRRRASGEVRRNDPRQYIARTRRGETFVAGFDEQCVARRIRNDGGGTLEKHRGTELSGSITRSRDSIVARCRTNE
jgi:hypothetical protein